jgi:hypothetical protein
MELMEEEEAKTEEIWIGKMGEGKERKEGRVKAIGVGAVEITARDVEVLEWVCEHYFSTKAILLERFFGEPMFLTRGQQTGQYGSRRVTKLEREGYLQPSRYKVLGQVPLLLSPLGYKLLHGRERALAHHHIPDIDIANFEHDVWVQRLRTKFELGFGATRWKTDRLLQRIQSEKQLPYVPDGRFYVGAQAWNLEVERTPKRKDRLREILKVRAEGSTKTRVLYVLDRRFSDFYREHMAVTVNPGCFFITYFDDLDQVHWVGSDGAALPLQTLFQAKEGAASESDRHV